VNTDEVEAFFAGLGFTVLYPEDYDFADQVTMFTNAEVIAGYAGSSLFNMMFAPEKTVIVICPEMYTATNEYLMASVTGARLHYFLAESEIQHSPPDWSWAAYQSNFRFDVRRHAAEIRDVVQAAST
jgi:capsular polysaccharide biosynthesis protein